jgi:hypothetical protein
MDQSQRPVFFEGQYLGAADLTAAMLYEHVQTARHTLGAHTWGIAIGLDLFERALPSGTSVDVSLLPGVAWDGYGNAVVITSPVKLSVDAFANFQTDTPDGGVLVKIWVRYKEAATATTPAGFALCSGDTSNRVAESYAIVVGDPPKGPHDSITLAGRSVQPDMALQLFNPDEPTLYDESVPFQQFPESGDKRRWLIPVGMVRWFKQGSQPGTFLPRDDSGGSDGLQTKDSDQIRAFRRYLGVVAESVQAAGGVIRLRDRSVDPTKVHFQPPQIDDVAHPPENDLVWVEGNLRVLGDARLLAGTLDFRTDTGDRKGVPQVLRRVDGNKAGGSDLQALFAAKDGATGKNAFSVGNVNVDSTGALKEIVPFLTVRDNGLTCVGGDTPAATLHVAGDLAIDKISGGAARALPAHATLIWNDGAWLWLNANQDQSQPIPGVRTPGEFACGSLNVGGIGGNWSDPGAGNAWFGGSLGIGTNTLDASVVIQSPNKHQGKLWLFRNDADFEYDGGDDFVFVFQNNGNVTAFMGGKFGFGTTTPNAQLHVSGNMQVDNGFNASGASIFNGACTFVNTVTCNQSVTLHQALTSSSSAQFTDVIATGSLSADHSTVNTLDVNGTVNIVGDINVGGSKNFAIPHPKNAAGQWLVHAAIEGPEAAVFYRGESCLRNGAATVDLPDYFEALTCAHQRTVQITPLYEGDEPVSALASTTVHDGRFRVRMITPGNPEQRFYWEVKAVRSDLPALQVERPADASFMRS